jgi:hypothetical protein
MSCTGLEPCHDFPARNLTKVPVMPGMDLNSEDRASLDPKTLLSPPVAPPAPGAKALPPVHRESSLGYSVATEHPTISPVKRMKMRWKAEDLVNANEKLLRR